MLEAEQYQACLRHVEQLEKADPDRACLLSIKALLLRIHERYDEARETTARFLQKHPGNPVALAESALLAAMEEDTRQAMRLILDALTASRKVHPRVYQAMHVLDQILAADGYFLAARALAVLRMHVHRQDPDPAEFLMQLNAAPNVPLVVKQSATGLGAAAENAPWTDEFVQARSVAADARWTEAEERFARLAEQVGGEPAIWRTLATLRAWLADTAGCIEALRRLAALDVPLEDAVEAEALALFLSDDPLGDRLDEWMVTFKVQDVERLEELLLSGRRVAKMRPESASIVTDEVPPPRSVFVLFDRASPLPGTDITHENLGRVVCTALLFGKQTDRDARFELLHVPASDLDDVKMLVTEIGGEALDGEPEQEVIGSVPATRHLLARNWRLPPGLSPDEFRRIMSRYAEHALLEVWPQSPLGLLDGKCPQEAAGEAAYRVRLLAAIMVIEYWLEEAGIRFDLNRLRSRLGLPALEPIDPDQTPLKDLPLVRWARVEVDKLPDEALVEGYRRAVTHRAAPALRNLAAEVADRASLAGRPERRLALEMMITAAEDLDQALRYLEAGRREPNQPQGACAHWDLVELPLRVQRGEGEEAQRLFEHVESRHINEPGVARAITELLIRLGFLRPDGTPTVPEEPAEEPSLVLPGQGGARPGELWTPDSQKPAGEGPKIWTPGQE